MRKSDCGNAWMSSPDVPITLSFFTSTRGLHFFHIYLWLLKDIMWMRGYFWLGNGFGSLNVLVGLLAAVSAIYKNIADEMFLSFCQLLWVLGNMWWMSGELHDIQFHHGPILYYKMSLQAARILLVALCFTVIYLFIIRPSNILTSKRQEKQKSDKESILQSRIWFCSKYLDYEQIHLLFWLGQDYSWCIDNGILWLIFFIPTCLISLDFALISMNRRNYMVNHTHYVAQFVWVFGNGIWAIGELFFPENDLPSRYIFNDPIRWKTFRWYSEWILTLAFVPIVSLYIIWIYYTWTGEIVQDSKKTQDIDDMTPLNDDQDDFANANESTLA